MRYEGQIYRPPSEARSLILQVTIGCAHNTCTFCNMYKAKQFRVRTREEALADLEELHEKGYGPYFRKVFFADGDALVLPTETLLVYLAAVKKYFPNVTRVASYGTAQDVLRKRRRSCGRCGMPAWGLCISARRPAMMRYSGILIRE